MVMTHELIDQLMSHRNKLIIFVIKKQL